MRVEEFNEILQNNSISLEDFNRCLPFLTEDSLGEAKYVELFYQFINVSAKLPEVYPLLEMHRIANNYLLKGIDYPDIWKLYFFEMEYFYYVDCPSEVMKFANRVLTLDDKNIEKAKAYNYAIIVFFRLGMYKQANTYIDEADIYLKNHDVSARQAFEVLINEMDVFAAIGAPKKYIAVKDKLDTILETMVTDPYYDSIKLFLSIHDLYARVMLKDQFANDKGKLVKLFKEYLANLRNYPYISENYATLFIPVFNYFINDFKLDELIGEILKILKYRMSVSERTSLYRYLIEDLKISQFTYPDIYKEYIHNLTNYFEINQKNKEYEIHTEILNFSLEKKLDIISAKYHYDPLTGCYNRVFLSEIEERILEPGDAVIYMDLNDFKKINDTYGHETGDKQLKIFADILLHHFSDDIVLRIGGDEFVILTRGLPEDILAKIDEARAEYLTHNLLKNRYGFSAGVLFAKDIMLHEAIGLADMAMYDSKNTGLPLCLKEV